MCLLPHVSSTYGGGRYINATATLIYFYSPCVKLQSEDINIAVAAFISIYLLSVRQAGVDWINRRQTGVTFV